MKKISLAILNRPDLKQKITKSAPILNWNEAVGNEIAQHATPIKITSQGKLYVKVTDSSWILELTMHKNEIIQNLNNLSNIGFITDIIFKR